MENVQEILEWYVEAGVDVLLEDQPVNRFEESQLRSTQKSNAVSQVTQRLAEKKPASALPTTQKEVSIPDADTLDNARQAAIAASTLEELREAVKNFDGCNLKRTAKNTVFADGNPEADIMFIGEAPGRDEDAQGLPFVGRAGQLLDKMLAGISLTRETAYITNVIPWRPPGNRTPTPQETEICRPFIERHIELVKPNIIVLLGGSSAKTLLKTNDGIMKLRGRWAEIPAENAVIKTMPTLHPAYLLRQPAQKRLAWQDLLQILKVLKEK